MSKAAQYLAWFLGIALAATAGYMIYGSMVKTGLDNGKSAFTVEGGAAADKPAAQDPLFIGSPKAPIKLTYAVHWLEKFQIDGIVENGSIKSKGLRQYLEEYTSLHPEVSFQILPISYQDYANKLEILSDADSAPDIYQIYSPWAVSYVRKGILAEPPASVLEDVRKNYLANEGALVDGKVWGFPTEVNTYALLYNKNIFKELGIASYPKTWAELQMIAERATKKDASGNITQYGIAFLKGNDWQEVDPFLSLLFSNGGKFISDDQTKALFNSPQGVAALDAELELFRKGTTNIEGSFFDFGAKKVAMVIAPPWVKGIFKNALKDSFDSTVGSAPLPPLKAQTALRYSWFMGVMAKSKNKEAAWNFLQWFNTDEQPRTKTTRNGDLLANTIGAIPSRLIDINNQKVLSQDSFTKTFVGQLKNGVPEPNVLKIGDIKQVMLGEIESAFTGSKTAKQALDAAAAKVNVLLAK